MKLTDEALLEFEKLWVEDHPGTKTTDKELREKAERVMQAVALVYRQIPLEKIKKFHEINAGQVDIAQSKSEEPATKVDRGF